MEFNLFDSGAVGEYNGACFVEISKVLVMQDAFFYEHDII